MVNHFATNRRGPWHIESVWVFGVAKVMFKQTHTCASVIRWSWACDLREPHRSMVMKYLSPQRSLAASVSVLPRVCR